MENKHKKCLSHQLPYTAHLDQVKYQQPLTKKIIFSLSYQDPKTTGKWDTKEKKKKKEEKRKQNQTPRIRMEHSSHGLQNLLQ